MDQLYDRALIEKFMKNSSINFLLRNSEKSLPLSILEGINFAKYEHVLA